MRARVLAVAALIPLVAGGCGIEDDRPLPPGSTLEQTLGDPDGNGELSRQKGEPFTDRTELAPKGRADREVARFAQLTDTHVRDEESPARVPFLDRLGPPVTSTFRPQEAVSSQVLTAMVRAINEERPRQILVTGDLLDNAQRNELDMLLAVLAGGEVDPDSGGKGYRGVQASSNPDGFFYRPSIDAPRHKGLPNRAQSPFFSPGLRVPWYAAIGNHDVLVQGELPPSATTDAIATGDEALFSFDPRLRDLLDGLPRGGEATPDLRGVPPEQIERVLAEGLPGKRTKVPPDPRRAALTPRALIDRLREAGTPSRDGANRLNYAIDLGPELRALVLDTTNRAGKAAGVVTAQELAFLRRELARKDERAILLVSHHGLPRSEGRLAKDALWLVDRDPRVVAEISGDNHRHRIRPRRATASAGRWEIHTASLADWPQQGRMFRLVTGADGSRALETWVVDHAGTVSAFDQAGFGRELAFLDAQGGRPNGLAGERTDRNVRLWLPPAR
jgi:3',5'-cyclic AMP phosphodiesterase CpdA